MSAAAPRASAPARRASEESIGDFCGSLRLQVRVLLRCLEAQQVPPAASEPAASALLEAIGAAGRGLCVAAAAAREPSLEEPGSFSRQLSVDSVPPPNGVPAQAPHCTSSPVLLKKGGARDAARTLPKAISDQLEEQHAELMEQVGREAGRQEQLLRQLIFLQGGPVAVEAEAVELRMPCSWSRHGEEVAVQKTETLGRDATPEDRDRRPPARRPRQKTASQACPMATTRRGLSYVDDEERKRKLAAEVEHMKVRDDQFNGTESMSSLQPCQENSTMRRVLKRLVKSGAFELFFCVAIVANAAWIGFEVNYRAGAGCRWCHSHVFLIVGHAFSALFVAELSVRLGAEGLHFFHGGSTNAFWNYFDTLIVAITVFEVLLEIASLLDPDTTSWANVRVLRIMRVTRLLRVVRVTRIVRYVRALRTLVYSIACTLKSLFWASVLLMLIMYVFGILFTSAASDGVSLEEDTLVRQDMIILERYWSSVGTSMFTLFKAMTSGVTWDEVVHPLAKIHWFWPTLFTAFIAFCVFAVLNVMTGVFCQSAIESAAHDQELLIQSQMQNKAHYISRAKSLFQEIDKGDSGIITIAELEQRLQDSQVRNWLQSLDIDADDAWTLFKLIDTDQSNIIDIEEFVMGCLRLKGTARSIDMQRLLYEQRGLIKRLLFFMSDVAGSCGAEVARDMGGSPASNPTVS